ncbi:hypothetical protein MRY87_11380, partial [bacterium]|nr:hypothetical protein [bacterium]
VSSSDITTVPSTESEYFAAVDVELDKIAGKLGAVQESGMVANIAFAMPPGFFVPNVSPPHSRMFSDPTLQTWYINMLERLVERFSSEIDSGLIGALDILTEPADSSKQPNNGADDWEDLLVRAVNAVQAVKPELTLLVKPLYGDIQNLKRQPCYNQFDNVEPATNAYISPRFQHSNINGFNAPPFQIERPSKNIIGRKIINEVAKFLRKQVNNCGASFDDLHMSVGEWSAPTCAKENAQFAADFMYWLERDDLSEVSSVSTKRECNVTKREERSSCRSELKGKKRKRCIARAKKKAKRCIKKVKKQKKKNKKNGNNNSGGNSGSGLDRFADEVRFKRWTYQSIGGTKDFDPRYECDQDGNNSFAGQTDVFDELDVYFARNELNE